MRTSRVLSVLGSLIASLLTTATLHAQEGQGQPPPAQAAASAPIIERSVKHDRSPALRNLPPLPPQAGPKFRDRRLLRLTPSRIPHRPVLSDPVVQSSPGSLSAPATSQNFEGISSLDQAYTIGWVLPPDTNGDIGPNHYVQVVNVTFAVYDRSGKRLYGPAAINTVWQGFGGACEMSNDGDPTVLYDHLADRWLISQLAIPNFPDGPFYQCIAVSETGDPLGNYHRYAFVINNSWLNDYPKLGVWPDGYYLSVNQFLCMDLIPPFGYYDCQWKGPRVAAFERAEMLQGNSDARMVAFDLPPSNLGGLLPSDLDGPPSPAGTPNVFAQVDDGAWFNPPVPDRLQLWEFHVDWTTPPNSTFGPSLPNQPDVSATTLATAPFDSNMCGYDPNCIPQPGQDILGLPSPGLDALSDRLMHRLQYRRFPTHESLVATHTVDVGNDRAGIRWYELRKEPGAGWSIYQQGTYAPADGDHRWMGSIAMDSAGNIALGFSVASPTTWPSIRYVMRQASDPLGEMGTETPMIDGSGAQEDSSGRWGDYSAMSVDPTDDCTFWYTQEYYQTIDLFYGRNWQTRVAAFREPSCGSAGSTPSLTITDAAVTEGDADTTLATFTVSLSSASTQTATVAYATADGTASAGSDYIPASGTLTFPSGTTTQTIKVGVTGDAIPEPDETFFVNLSNPVGATLARAQGVGTIRNDDPYITVVEPNGGETWRVKKTRTIRWNSSLVTGDVKIELSRNGGATWEVLFASTPNDGSQNWKVSGPTTAEAKIRVSGKNEAVFDTSDGVFRIAR